NRTDPKAENEMILSLMAQCLRGRTSNLTRISAGILANHRAEPDLVVPLFISWLTNSNWELRSSAAYGLRQYGERATSAVPALVTALNDTHPIVRLAAEDALFEIDPAALEKANPGVAERRNQWRRIRESQQRSYQ